jgi:RNA polymerase sigma-70 factor (ECF subfamily)
MTTTTDAGREGATSADLTQREIRARAGDRAAFDLLAVGVVDGLYRIARLVLRDADMAEDAVQETLVRCWRDLPALRDPVRFEPWLRRVLLRAITDEFRRGRRARAAITLLRLEPAIPDAAEDVVVREQLDRGFGRLTVDHRAVLVLRLYLGLSIEETAATLGIPVGTAKSRLHYATDAMRVALDADARPTGREVSE